MSPFQKCPSNVDFRIFRPQLDPKVVHSAKFVLVGPHSNNIPLVNPENVILVIARNDHHHNKDLHANTVLLKKDAASHATIIAECLAAVQLHGDDYIDYLIQALAYDAMVFATHNFKNAQTKKLDTDMAAVIEPKINVSREEDGLRILKMLAAHAENHDLNSLELLEKEVRKVENRAGTVRVAFCQIPLKFMVS